MESRKRPADSGEEEASLTKRVKDPLDASSFSGGALQFPELPPSVVPLLPSGPGATECELRLLVNAKSAGRIIGKGGATINRMRAATSAVIKCEEGIAGAPKRVVTVRGYADQGQDVLNMILDVLQESPEGERKEGEPPAEEKDDHQLTLLIQKDYVGGLIGKSGTKINATRETTGAKLKVSDATIEDSTEKTLDIRGTREQMRKALAVVVPQIQAEQERGPKGFQIPYVPKPVVMAPPMPYGLPYGGYGLYGHGMMPPFMPHGGAAAAAQSETSTMSLPNDTVGHLIGKGGQTIKAIREQSGATIKISDNTGGGTRTVTITGTKLTVDRATTLIQQACGLTQPDAQAAAAPGAAAYGAGVPPMPGYPNMHMPGYPGFPQFSMPPGYGY